MIKDPIKRREYHAKYNREVWYPRNRKAHHARAAKNKQQRVIRFKELKAKLSCNHCPEDHPACLDFHHLDPSKKEFGISGNSVRDFSWDRILKEIAKCEVLCSNCHRKEHFNAG